jgi:hypothetical protein
MASIDDGLKADGLSAPAVYGLKALVLALQYSSGAARCEAS